MASTTASSDHGLPPCMSLHIQLDGISFGTQHLFPTLFVSLVKIMEVTLILFLIYFSKWLSVRGFKTPCKFCKLKLFVILPFQRRVYIAFFFVSIATAILGFFAPNAHFDKPLAYSFPVAVAFGVIQQGLGIFIYNGISFMMVQKSFGRRALWRAGSFAFAWAVIVSSLITVAFMTEDDKTQKSCYLALYCSQAALQCVLLFYCYSFKIYETRWGIRPYLCFNLVIDALFAFTYTLALYGVDASICMEFVCTLIDSFVSPFIVYYALFLDSKFWRVLGKGDCQIPPDTDLLQQDPASNPPSVTGYEKLMKKLHDDSSARIG